MNKQNKSVSTANLVNLAGVFAIFALIGFCCWFGKTSNNLTTSVTGDSPGTIEIGQVHNKKGMPDIPASLKYSK